MIREINTLAISMHTIAKGIAEQRLKPNNSPVLGSHPPGGSSKPFREDCSTSKLIPANRIKRRDPVEMIAMKIDRGDVCLSSTT